MDDMLTDLLICAYIYLLGRKYLICPKASQMARGCLYCANASRCNGTDYGMGAVMSWKMAVGCIHRIKAKENCRDWMG